MRTRLILLVFALSLGLGAQPNFEVASIRPMQGLPDDPIAARIAQQDYGVKISGRQVVIRDSMAQLVAYGYAMRQTSIQGLPKWSEKTYFEIHARMPENTSADQLPDMVRALLSDRFQLTAHQDDIAEQGYALTIGKGQLKIGDARDIDPSVCSPWVTVRGNERVQRCSSIRQTDSQRVVTSFSTGGPISPTRRVTLRPTSSADSDSTMTAEYYRITMPVFAEMLKGSAGEHVEDRTGVEGERDLVMERSCTIASCESDAVVLQRLGLRLERATVHMQVLVVGGVSETPKEN